MKALMSILTLVIAVQVSAQVVVKKNPEATDESLVALQSSGRIKQQLETAFDIPAAGHVDAHLLLIENDDGTMRASVSMKDSKVNYVWTLAEKVTSINSIQFTQYYLEVDVTDADGVKQINLMPLTVSYKEVLSNQISVVDRCTYNRRLARDCGE